MKNSQSGNGVKVAQPKLVREILAIISGNKSRKEKIQALCAVDFTGRPGQDEAEKIIETYRKKFQRFELRSSTGKFPRGDKRISEAKYLIGFSDNCKWLPRNADFRRNNWTTDTPFQQWERFKFSNWRDAFDRVIQKKFPDAGCMTSNLTHENYREFAASNPFTKAAEAQAAADKLKLDKLEFSKKSGLPQSYFGQEKTLEQLQSTKSGYALFNNHYIVLDEYQDWNAYSKSWHNQHGPKRWTDNRRVVFTKPNEKLEYPLEAFSGNFLFRAIIETFKVPKPKTEKSVKEKLPNFQAVQLNPYFEVRIKKSNKNITVGERLFGNQHYDWWITDNHHTYHSFDKESLTEGLRQKQQAAIKAEQERLEKENKILTAEYCHQTYNFCYTGISEFADLNGLDLHGSYTIREIRNAVVQNRKENCNRFKTELKTIGIQLGC